MENRFERAYYRLVYPLTARPILRVGERAFEVVDLSEEGIRFLAGPSQGLQVGDEFEGTLELPSGDTYPIEGMVLRIGPPQIAAKLVRGIPFSAMLTEQKYIQSRYTNRR